MNTAAVLALVLTTAAAPPIPEELKPWVPWVLGDSALCPRDATGDAPACAFPAALDLDLDDQGGRFVLSVRTFADAVVKLPGDDKRWPLALKDRSGRRVVVEPGPTVRLAKGSHKLSGAFRWDSLPEALRVPPDVALLSLKVRGKNTPAVRAEDGRLYLDKRASEDSTADRLTARVVRKLKDGIPLLLETRITLEISGDGREETLGPALPDGFIPVSIAGGLPARLDTQGLLVVQVRPGTHTLTLIAQLSEDRERFAPPTPTATWAIDEVWVFEAAQDLRQTRLEGIAVDPARTHLPAEWKRLPAYRASEKSPLSVFTERRGDENQGSDQLTLSRELWLDFDGRGYTFRDVIGGQLNTGWRIEAAEELALGRVQVAGADQFITQRAGSQRKGVEVRARRVQVVADSRYEGKPTSIPAVGWAHDFSQVSSTLHLPPGVHLLHASGVDSVSETWVKDWTMLDLFLALLMPVLVWRLWGWRWGVLAFAAFVLLIPEAPVLCWALLVALIPEALLRVVPEGIAEKLIRVTRLSILIGLSLGAVAFGAQHIRVAMYPALERPYEGLSAGPRGAPMGGFGNINNALEDEFSDIPTKNIAQAQSELDLGLRGRKLSGKSKKEYQAYRLDQSANLSTFDPKAQVQTGPGLPRWTWNTVNLSFSGPVTQTQRIRLHLMGPLPAFFLAVIRVVLMALLLLCVMGLPGRRWPRSLKEKHGAWTVWCLPLLLFANGASAEVPDKAVLDELKARLSERPACAPRCATAGELKLEATEDRLRLKLDASVAADVEVQLLSAASWKPARVLVDGKPWDALRIRGGGLFAALTEGAHTVVLEGPLPNKPSVQIELALKPHHVTASAKGWRVDGVHEDGLSDDTLQLTREAQREEKVEDQGVELPPLAQITRTISLGMNWEVFTVVERRSPLGRAIVLEVPSLKGEQVTSEGARAADGKVFVNLAPNAQQVHWRSTLQQAEVLELLAPKGVPWTEVWELEAAPMWHVETEGIFPIHIPAGDRRVWQPWPGEKVNIELGKPVGTEGQTLTVDHVVLELRPGRRATDATLTFEARSSRGDQHILTLPSGAELTSVSIDGNTQPIRQDGAKVKLPLEPRSQTFVVGWRSDSSISTLYKTPNFDLGVPSVNVEVHVKSGRDRWVLFATGPRLGPAVLIWSLLAILIALAVGLSRVRSAPPTLLGWILLCLGLSQVNIVAGGMVAGWLLVFAWRKDFPEMHYALFNMRQIAIAGWTLIALGILLFAIGEGLLGDPEMQIRGNQSSGSVLRWTVDRTAGPLPTCTILSLPALAYRLAMLLWSLWLAFALFGWLKEGWSIFAKDGLYRKNPNPPPPFQPKQPPKPQPEAEADDEEEKDPPPATPAAPGPDPSKGE
jgi:hypothetical protein